MNAMFTAFIAIAVISVGAWYALGELGSFSSGERQTTNDAVRLD